MKTFREYLQEGFRDDVKKAVDSHIKKHKFDPDTAGEFKKNVIRHALAHNITDAKQAIKGHIQGLHRNKEIPVEKFFHHSVEIGPVKHREHTGGRIERVHIQNLVPTQHTVDSYQVHTLSKHPSKVLPTLVRQTNSSKYWLMDGHHRVAARIKRGEKFISAHVRDEIEK